MQTVRSSTPRVRRTAFWTACWLLCTTTIFVACAGPGAARRSQPAVYDQADEMPELIGGLAALQQHIHYPAAAKTAGIEGQVLVEFIVNQNGEVVDAKVTQGVGGGLDEASIEALRQVRFKPGREDGKPVAVRLVMPFTYRLPKEQETDNSNR